MLNGKFFVGLPAGMMDHSSGPNRQQTNFFWPDESRMEAAVDTRSRLRHKNRPERTPEKAIVHEVNPDELHKQQLSSKINLDENLPKPTYDAPVKQSNLKRRDTFSSKIQFYDFDNEPTPPRQTKPIKNSNVEVEKNLKNSTKTCDKRISFIDNKSQQKTGANLDTLKNNHTSPKHITNTLPKRPIIKNLSKSKSMTDIAAEKNIKVIENNVKNISLVTPTRHIFNDSDDNVGTPRRQVRTLSRPTTLLRRSHPITEYYDDLDDDHFYSDRKQLPAASKYSNYNRTHRTIQREPKIEENFMIGSNNRGKIQESHQTYTKSSERRYSNRGRNFDDDYEYHFESRGSEANPPRRIAPKQTSTIKGHFDVDHYYSDAPTRDSHEKFNISPHFSDHNIDEGQKPNNPKRNPRSQATTPAPATTANRPLSRAHRHLVSNVAFWSDNESNNNTNHRTIRNSAVTRVSVGLPDT